MRESLGSFSMIGMIRDWFAEGQRRQTAKQRALAEFGRTRGVAPLGAHLLHSDHTEDIVRVTYRAEFLHPGRAWYVVPRSGQPVRELAFEDVASHEELWR